METIILNGFSTIDRAGVKLFRAFGNENTKPTDPFLLLAMRRFDRFTQDA
jgi:hypothetical protein